MSPETPAEAPEFLVSYDIDDLALQGVAVEVDAQTADELGAFEETALSEEAAAEANGEGGFSHG